MQSITRGKEGKNNTNVQMCICLHAYGMGDLQWKQQQKGEIWSGLLFCRSRKQMYILFQIGLLNCTQYTPTQVVLQKPTTFKRLQRRVLFRSKKIHAMSKKLNWSHKHHHNEVNEELKTLLKCTCDHTTKQTRPEKLRYLLLLILLMKMAWTMD